MNTSAPFNNWTSSLVWRLHHSVAVDRDIVQQAHEEAAAGNKESKAGQGCDEMDRVTVVTLGEWYKRKMHWTQC